MEARMRAVEGAIVRIETILHTLATKADLHEAISAQTKWFVGRVTVIGTGLVMAAFLIAKYVH